MEEEKVYCEQGQNGGLPGEEGDDESSSSSDEESNNRGIEAV